MMKSLKVLAFSLATLLPAFSWGARVVYPAVVHGYEDGSISTAHQRGIKLVAVPEVTYDVKVTSTCQGQRDVDDMVGCTTPLADFVLIAQCADHKGKENYVKGVGDGRTCNPGESLDIWLRRPLKRGEPATIAINVGITYNSRGYDRLDILQRSVEAGRMPEEFIAKIKEMERVDERITQLDREIEEAHRRVAEARRRREQTDREIAQLDREIAQLGHEINASNREILVNLGDLRECVINRQADS